MPHRVESGLPRYGLAAFHFTVKRATGARPGIEQRFVPILAGYARVTQDQGHSMRLASERLGLGEFPHILVSYSC